MVHGIQKLLTLKEWRRMYWRAAVRSSLLVRGFLPDLTDSDSDSRGNRPRLNNNCTQNKNIDHE